MEEALNEDRYPIAQRMSELALNAARRSGDISLIKLSTERNNEVQEIQSVNLAAASAVAAKRCKQRESRETKRKMERTGGKAHGANSSKNICNLGSRIFEALCRAVGNTRGECIPNLSMLSDLLSKP